MKIVDLDYYAICGKSWLNKLSAAIKLIAVFFILLIVVLSYNYVLLGSVYSFLLAIILFSRVPKLKIIFLGLYPLIFVAFYIISVKNLTYIYALTVVFKAITAATSFSLLVFTTPYTEIFKQLNKILPTYLTAMLFMTYRSIFILWNTLENINLSMYLRGKPSIFRPIYSIQVLSNSIGYLVIKAIESSEKMYDALKLRGFSGDMRFLQK